MDTEEQFCAPVPEPLEYCLKDKCEFVDNDLPPEVPGAGPFAYAPLKLLFNGAGRIDLTYPDPFQIIKSKNKDKPDLQDLRSTFQVLHAYIALMLSCKKKIQEKSEISN